MYVTVIINSLFIKHNLSIIKMTVTFLKKQKHLFLQKMNFINTNISKGIVVIIILIQCI
jgi:hypothetical protein